MEKIYSQIEEGKIISTILRKENISQYRTDLCDDNEFIQVCARKLKNNIKVGAHRHLPIERQSDITQEVWIVLKGKIKVGIHDLDSSFIQGVELVDGDCLVLFRGGHSLEVLEDETLFYEIKNGPYYGADCDKEFINE